MKERHTSAEIITNNSREIRPVNRPYQNHNNNAHYLLADPSKSNMLLIVDASATTAYYFTFYDNLLVSLWDVLHTVNSMKMLLLLLMIILQVPL